MITHKSYSVPGLVFFFLFFLGLAKGIWEFKGFDPSVNMEVGYFSKLITLLFFFSGQYKWVL
jgi:hypothetical protein